MQLHITSVTLLYHPLERIPVWIGRSTLLSCKIAAPRFQLAGIQGIALTSYLKEDGIDTILLKVIQLTCQYLLHAVTTHALKLTINTLNPSSSELPFRVLSYC